MNVTYCWTCCSANPCLDTVPWKCVIYHHRKLHHLLTENYSHDRCRSLRQQMLFFDTFLCVSVQQEQLACFSVRVNRVDAKRVVPLHPFSSWMSSGSCPDNLFLTCRMPSSFFFSLHLVRFQQRPPRSRTNAAWNEKCILFFCIPELPAPRRVFCSRLRVPVRSWINCGDVML